MHLSKGPLFTRTDFEPYNFSDMANIFYKCYAFNINQGLSDFDIINSYLQGPLFDGFILVQEIPNETGAIQRKTCATLTLCHRQIDRKNSIISIYNMCISPDLQGLGLGKIFMAESLKMLYRHLKLTPSKDNPVLLALTLLVHSPTYMSACKMYFSQGFYRYSFGNIAYQHNKELVSIIEDLKKLTFDSPKTTFNHSFEQEWQEWRTTEKLKLNQFDKSKGFKPSPYGKNQDLAFSLYRLDYYGDGSTIDFSFPPTDFCSSIQPFMQDKYETLFQPADIHREIQFQPKKNKYSDWNDSSMDDYEEEEDFREYL